MLRFWSRGISLFRPRPPATRSFRIIAVQSGSEMAAEHVETVAGPTTPVWPGFEGIDTMIMFGDSYTAVGYDYLNGPHPTKENPIGMPLPGQTWAEGFNWCGHLLRTFVKKDKHQPLVYNYAQGGDTVAGVESQIARGFLKRVGQRPDWAPWTSETTLFLTWIGAQYDAAATYDLYLIIISLLMVQVSTIWLIALNPRSNYSGCSTYKRSSMRLAHATSSSSMHLPSFGSRAIAATVEIQKPSWTSSPPGIRN